MIDCPNIIITHKQIASPQPPLRAAHRFFWHSDWCGWLSSIISCIIIMRKSKEQIQKISAHVQFETVSPATKLLE